jgi:serine/threonine protein kinase
MSQDAVTRAGGFAAGSTVGRYVLEEQIGHGGMAAVFRARDEQLGRVVALKILAPALAADQAFRQRFARESRAAAAVDDPHIIPLYEAGESNGVLFIAMRYVPGGDVRSLLFREAPLPPDRVAAIVSPVASALDAAHASGLVHRDVKPANMLLDSAPGRPDHLYLSDFGLSKGSTGSVGLTGTGLFLGTVDYAAPEQINGHTVDGRADQYSLGCAAFEMLAGEPPFRRDHGMAVLAAHVTQPPPPLGSMRPGLPAALDAVFAKVLAKAPDDRYRTCGDFSDALRAALGLGRYDAAPRPSNIQTELASTPGPRPPASAPDPRPPASAPGPRPPASTPGPPAPRWPAQPPLQAAGYSPAGNGLAGFAETQLPSHPVPGFGPPPQPQIYSGGPPIQPPYQPGLADTRQQPRRSVGRWPLIVAAAAIAIALAVGIPLVYGLASGSPNKTSSSGRTSPGVTITPGTHAKKTPTSSSQSSPQKATPADWTPYQDSGEFSIDLPPGWAVSSTAGGEVKFTGPQPGFVVVVEWTNTPQTDAAATWQQLSSGKASSDPSYHEIFIKPVQYRDYSTTADWEFTDDYPAGESNEFYDRGFVVHPGTLGFAIELYGPSDQFQSVYASLWQNLTATFHPAS